MHDLRWLKDNLDAVRAQLGPRAGDVSWENLRKLIAERSSLTVQVEDLRHQLKKGSEEVGRLKREKQPADDAMARMKLLGDRIREIEEHLRDIEGKIEELALRIPNLPHESVPAGQDASNNLEVRRWGTAPTLSFAPKSHADLGEALGILNFEQATRMTGARFAVMTDQGARLERALINYMLDLHTERHGYREVLPPFMVNRQAMTGTGQLPKFEEDLFRLRDDEYFLIPTAEVP